MKRLLNIIILLSILGIPAFMAYSWKGVFWVSALIIIPVLWIVTIGGSQEMKKYQEFIKKNPEVKL